MSGTHLTSLQQNILDIVHTYPGRFTRSGLAKMLVGAKSWQDREFPEYGRFSKYRRKEIGYQIEILLQQAQLQVDGHNCLVPVSSSSGVGEARDMAHPFA
ncbi:MAG TPA: hypothetical protein PLD25_31250 [Chloroflexota bacterium]|nr:hypothetical protein [Chloroflexota bacterium]HUM67523.1 hypothetical protein [Chloroflexota bacterium]